MCHRNDSELIGDALRNGDIALLEEFASLIDDFPDGGGNSFGTQWIVRAVSDGAVEAIHWMLAQNVSINFPAHDGYTVLHSCIESRRSDKSQVLTMLIVAGADLNKRGIHNYTALHMAAMRDECECIRLLIDAGADRSIKTQIDNFATAEEEARKFGHRESADLIRDYVPGQSSQKPG